MYPYCFTCLSTILYIASCHVETKSFNIIPIKIASIEIAIFIEDISHTISLAFKNLSFEFLLATFFVDKVKTFPE